jgi:trimeric autotransporter adhesin
LLSFFAQISYKKEKEMKTKHAIQIGTVMVLVLTLLVGSEMLVVAQDPAGFPLTAAFTYQGQLKNNGIPYTGVCDFQFSLWDDFTNGTQIGTTQTIINVGVTDGYFNVLLDYGADKFQGEARWLAIDVRCPAGTGTYTQLTPRQQLTSTPYALYASNSWQINGNFGTSPGVNYIGTNDNQALVFKVNGERVLRLEPNSFSPNLIGGNIGNWAYDGVYGASISGGGNYTDTNVVTDNYGTVGGGAGNQAGDDAGSTADAEYATVGGGYLNSASGDWSTVGGGTHNNASGNQDSICGGEWNTTSGGSNTIAGGVGNTASGGFATIGGGDNNIASDYSATVAGGLENTASGAYTTVGGGGGNSASFYKATVSGGSFNTASSDSATVSGGYNNIASAARTTIGGGYQNTASGNAATVPGGADNQASGAYSFAAGANAHATDDGSFVWSSSESTDSYGIDTFTVRAHGGARFYTAAGTGTGVVLQAGSGSWSSLSDQASKENINLADTQALLKSVATLPIATWNYKSQDTAIRHIGPMAQDFYAAFGVGEDKKYISSIDADGVALASIQGLYTITQEQKAQIETLKTENANTHARLTALEAIQGTRNPTVCQPAFNLNTWLPGLFGLLGVAAGALISRKRGNSL